MKIIYTYKKDVYAAYRAAYLHLRLNPSLIPKPINKLKDMNKEVKLYYAGLDEELNEVYIANGGRNITIFNNVIKGVGNIYQEEIKIINFD
ncbi:DUF3189 family protein [Natronincola ferrireducens]|uniref:Uncharacterized protein n=1 Tax=Natronincola ferrireducens TaxID=393762 RepID=A0A1G9BR49_9FIRM|nr:DUF3189 family protein [Natronincola ferrireducens]SDK41425.1 Protein of unknown function [Natronincola ferrireducens]